jgi:hypothetical protein
MKIPQLSIFIENRSGKLAEITTALGDVGISIRAMSLADTSEFGILRMVVDDPARAHRILKDYGYAVSRTDVIAVEIDDRPGALGRLLQTLAGEGQNVDYLYAFVQKGGESAVMIMKPDDLDRAIETLTAKGISLLPCSRIVKM